MRIIAFFGFVFSVLPGISLGAGSGSVIEMRRFETAPAIDGVLEDSWLEAGAAGGLYQLEPREGAAMTEGCTVYAGYDAENLYFAFEVFDSRPDLVRARLTPREQIWEDDIVGVLLDTFGDKRRAYEFFSNPLGVQGDAINLGGSEDDAPDFVWYSKGALSPSGYMVEMKIPFKSLRFPRSRERSWRLSFFRAIRRTNERGVWPAYHSANGDLFSQFADVKGLAVPENAVRLEAIPEFTVSHFKPHQELKGAFHLNKLDARSGGTVRYGLTPDWTLDAAANPDFSQVEADAPQLTANQRYALFYPEKRPFFMEGADAFSTPIRVLHTRTIADVSYGVKLTGKEGPYTGGALLAGDRSGSGSAVSVARVKRDIGEQSSLGLIYSGRADAGRAQNRVGGVDGNFWLNKTSQVSFQTLGSYTGGGSPHEEGNAVYGGLYSGDRNYDLALEYIDVSPDFRMDNGFVSRSDMKERAIYAGYKFWQDGGLLSYWQPNAGYYKDYNYAGELTDEAAYTKWNFMLPRQTKVSVAYYPCTYEKFGGKTFARQAAVYSLYGEPLKWLTGSASLERGDGVYYDASDPYLGDKNIWSLSLTLKPLASLQLTQDLLNSRFDTKEGDRVYSENIWQTRLAMQWNRETSSRIIYRYGVLDRRGFVDALVSRTLVPGTAAHAGYNISFSDEDGVVRKTGETLFTKFSWLFRL